MSIDESIVFKSLLLNHQEKVLNIFLDHCGSFIWMQSNSNNGDPSNVHTSSFFMVLQRQIQGWQEQGEFFLS